jgi:hypothetical protein
MRDVPRASSPRQRLKQNTAGDVVTQVRKTVYQNRTVYSACCLNFVVNPVVRSWLQLKKFDMLSLVSSYSLHYLYFICPSSHALYCWDPDRLSEHLSPVEFRSFWLPLPRSFSLERCLSVFNELDILFGHSIAPKFRNMPFSFQWVFGYLFWNALFIRANYKLGQSNLNL